MRAVITVIASHTFSSGLRLLLRHGDLTQDPVDAIVNAANEHLAHGGGVAGAIVRQGGAVIQRESDAWVAAHGPLTHDRVAVTSAGTLPCRHVIHAVGPVWDGGGRGEEESLRQAYAASLEQAHAMKIGSVAFPSISTGIFGFPVARGAEIAVGCVQLFAQMHGESMLRVVSFTIIDAPTVATFRTVIERLG